MSDISHELRSRAQDYREPDSIGPLLAEAADEIDRLRNLFGSRFHLDSTCGSCGGPLEVERDAICCRCTDADTQAVVDQLRKTEDGVAIVPGRTYWTLQLGEPIPWLCRERPGYGDGRLYSTRDSAQKARKA